MVHRITLLVLAVLLLALTPLQARELTEPDNVTDNRAKAKDRQQPGTRPPARDSDKPHSLQGKPQRARRTPRQLSDNPYSLRNKPLPALNSPYSSRGRSMSIYRNEQGRARGYSIRRPDGRMQYREFQGRGSKRGLPHAWQ